METKPKVGIFGITGCMGCQLSILFQDELFNILDKIDLVACPMIKEKNNKNNFDILFLEGTVVNKEDLKIVRDLRKRAKVLVAIGACAAEGCIPQIKNFMDKKKVEKAVYRKTEHLKAIDPVPLDKYVRVDYYIRGCPMDKEEFLQFIKDILLGKEFLVYEKPVCHACTLQENKCLLQHGELCLGPITYGNCSVMCPHYGFGCIGCRGPYTDANFEKYFVLLEEMKIKPKEAIDRINKYAGLRIKELMEKNIKEGNANPKFGLTCPPIKLEK